MDPVRMEVDQESEYDEPLQKICAQLVSNYPQYGPKIREVRVRKSVITAPNAIVDLLESQELQQEANKHKFEINYGLVLDFLIYLFEAMPLNAVFVLQDCSFSIDDAVAGKKPIDLVLYLVVTLFRFLSQNCPDSLLVKVVRVYQIVMLNCFVDPKSVCSITRLLSRRWYSASLTQLEIKYAYELLTKAGSAYRLGSSQYRENLQPYLYFDGQAKVGLQVLFSNNKWPFSKGMDLCVWFKALGPISSPGSKKPEKGARGCRSILMEVRTQQNCEIKVIQEKNQIAVECTDRSELSSRKVCDLPIDQVVRLEIILEPKETLFKSNEYFLRIRVNDNESEKVEVKVPKISASNYISEFNMFKEFRGQFYALILNKIDKHRARMPSEAINEHQIEEYMRQPLASELGVTILSPLRATEGLLLNHLKCGHNYARHSAKTVSSKTHEDLEPLSEPEVVLPLLLFISELLSKSMLIKDQPFNVSRKVAQDFFNIIVQNYVKAHYLGVGSFPVWENPYGKNYQLTCLFLFYFIELMGYPLTSKTLTVIYKAAARSPSDWYLPIKYLDQSILLQKSIQAITEMGAQRPQMESYDPVCKLQFLYFLETEWKKYWNRVQYSTPWWEPIGIRMQNDQPFSEKAYVYEPKILEQASEENRVGVEWEVSDFITNDFCHCLLLPQIGFKEEVAVGATKSSLLTRYRDEYIQKECMAEKFDEPMLISCLARRPSNLREKVVFKKVGLSKMDKIKAKLVKPVMRVLSGGRGEVEGEVGKSISGEVSKSMSGEMGKPINGEMDKSMRRGEEMGKRGDVNIMYCSPVCYLNLLRLVIGEIRLSESSIVFTMRHNSGEFDHMCVKVFKNEEFIMMVLDYSDVKIVKRRRFNQTMNGLEVRLKSGYGYLFYFYAANIDKFIACLNAVTKKSLVTMIKDPYDEYLKSNQTVQWMDKKISNWEYLQWLNDIAGRSYNDITQYPILPWTFISNSPIVDIKNPHSYRDLSKNMGSLGTEERIKHFMDKFENVDDMELFNGYHFGTHYSSSAIIFNFLIRLRPFSEGAVTLQSGKFDCADRIFSSYLGSWVNANFSPTDIRELIPQIYMLPEMLINANRYDFGVTQSKERICNVQLPQWAQRNPYTFCQYLRKSLEHSYVSDNISHWIDLIYGYKQRGKPGIQAMNIFFPLTYELAINVEKVSDPDERVSMETQIVHFGQNPAQIIGSSPHPVRSEVRKKWEGKLLCDGRDLVIQRWQLGPKEGEPRKPMFESVLESKDSIVSVQFLCEDTFLVVRRLHFCLFKIINDKIGFISKEQEADFPIETDHISLDYPNIQASLPMAIIQPHRIALLGGFYNGYLQVLFLPQVKFSRHMALPFSTISALAFCPEYSLLYVGDSEGRLGVYGVEDGGDGGLELGQVFRERAHWGRVNDISLNWPANLFATAGEDCTVKLFNLYSQEMYRKIEIEVPVSFARISICPLYSVIFYSRRDGKVRSYSINGQFLALLQDPSGLVHNLAVLPNTAHTECLVYLNDHREFFIYELPNLTLIKKMRLSKNESQISCFQASKKVGLVGSQDGTLQIITNTSSFF